MPIIAKNEGSFQQPPPGMQQAVCAFVFDIGTQVGEYKGKRREVHKVIVSWELAEKMPDGDFAGMPFMVSRYYTLSLNEKSNMRKDLESWRGRAFSEEELKGFDIEKLVGANCFLNLVRNENDKTVVSAITQLPKGTTKIVPVNKEPSEKFMEWVNRERAKSLEMTDAAPQHAVSPNEDDGLPF